MLGESCGSNKMQEARPLVLPLQQQSLKYRQCKYTSSLVFYKALSPALLQVALPFVGTTSIDILTLLLEASYIWGRCDFMTQFSLP
jgi:hypothetical protein